MGPKRLASGDVIRMTQGGSKKTKTCDDEEADHRTESEKHVQTLVREQLNTDVSFPWQFSKHRNFTSASLQAPSVDELTGLHQLEHFKHVEEMDSRVDRLRHYGLTDEEIVLKMKKDFEGKLTDIHHGLGADPAVIKQRLQDIESKIKHKETSLCKPDSFKGALELSRQARDLEESIAQRCGKESLLPKVLIAPKKFAESHPDDPINHIPNILKNVEGQVTREPRRDRRRRRKLERRNNHYKQFNIEETFKKNCIWDIDNDDNDSDSGNTFVGPLPRECYGSEDVNLSPSETKTVADKDSISDQCQRVEESSYTKNLETVPQSSRTNLPEIVSSSIVSSGSRKCVDMENLNLISEVDIIENRISIEEICKMEKFKNYSKGTPNKVLYVKNLPKKTTVEELVSVFGTFESDRPGADGIVYKLLTGRMVGQAFITFPDETVAHKALETVNGYKLREQPIILCYGRKHLT